MSDLAQRDVKAYCIFFNVVKNGCSSEEDIYCFCGFHKRSSLWDEPSSSLIYFLMSGKALKDYRYLNFYKVIKIERFQLYFKDSLWLK